ncbi:MAG: altronate dehydratase [Proteobacteria bacterium]|nr:altronate dehydratase [Pseudomonadota bacterium]
MSLTAADALIRLHPDDDVAVARRRLLAGESAGELCFPSAIPAAHKVALRPLPKGTPIRKYGQFIGRASVDIPAGAHVHVHNVDTGELATGDHFLEPTAPWVPLPESERRTFQGFARPGGRAGTRNYVAVISSVNCSASVSQFVARRFTPEALRRDFPSVDGVVAFTHKAGCATADEGTEILQRVLAGIARHPNIGAYVVIGLGCETNQAVAMVRRHGLDQPEGGGDAPLVLNIQQQGGISRTVEDAVKAVSGLLPAVNAQRRSPQPLSRLIVALNCGGSDGHSGITANPALGGAEHLLTRRAISREVSEALLERIRWWEDHARKHGASISNNPSAGNKEGGLTTIFEKSLGAVAKGGQAPLMSVLQYAEAVTGPGLCFMDTPGYDPVSMTGLVAGGCNVGVFTTGRGSVYGCKPAPCLKVSTHTPLYRWMEGDMDLNAGTILDGEESIAQVGERIFEAILATASGERTKSEVAGIGDEEFAPWPLGPVF